jgi:ADP-ribose pyrophosphatase YjhB (NUDIX family)
MQDTFVCPHCGKKSKRHRNPFPTVDIIIEIEDRILLIERLNQPFGWALPGGFVDYGESLEAAAIRETQEETGLEVKKLRQFRAYSDPHRDPRQHNISMVFIAETCGVPEAGDDAKNIQLFPLDKLPTQLCFDHAQILQDYISGKKCNSGSLSSKPYL